MDSSSSLHLLCPFPWHRSAWQAIASIAQLKIQRDILLDAQLKENFGEI